MSNQDEKKQPAGETEGTDQALNCAWSFCLLSHAGMRFYFRVSPSVKYQQPKARKRLCTDDGCCLPTSKGQSSFMKNPRLETPKTYGYLKARNTKDFFFG